MSEKVKLEDILKVPPQGIPETNDAVTPLHMLTCSKHVLQSLWSIKTFYGVVPQALHPALTLHDDGSLSDADVALYTRQLPGCRVILRKEADAAVAGRLSARDYPAIAAYRERCPLGMKMVDPFVYAEKGRILVLDTDLLFFSEPQALLAVMSATASSDDWVFMSDGSFAYNIGYGEARRKLGIQLAALVNTGIMVARVSSWDPTLAEAYLRSMGRAPYDGNLGFSKSLRRFSVAGRGNPDPWDEQTALAVMASRGHALLLPMEDYFVVSSGTPGIAPVCAHYAGAARPRMFEEGLQSVRVPPYVDGRKSELNRPLIHAPQGRDSDVVLQRMKGLLRRTLGL